ncbi:MAG: flagellar hook-length control protein FliK [Halomonadaceae bacterium]|nr:MAG: flagellar hook-length control protein FliK [Halomonadaceae bacterium]
MPWQCDYQQASLELLAKRYPPCSRSGSESGPHTMQITNSSPATPRGEGATLTGREGPSGGAATSPAQLLDQLSLKDGDSRLARLLLQAGGTSQEGGRALLEISGQRLPVQADGRIPAGDLIRVLRAGNELRLMALPEPPARSTLSQALAQKLPFQQDLQSGFNRLLDTASQSNQPQMRQALAQLLAMLPSQANLQSGSSNAPLQSGQPGQASGGAEAVRQWLSASGVFSEARLATAAPGDTLPPDLKQALLNTARQLLGDGRQPASPADTAAQLRALQPSLSPHLLQSGQLQFPAAPPPDMTQVGGRVPLSVGETLRLLAGMLNRISVNQLHAQVLSSGGASQEAATPTQTLMMELPWLTAHGEARSAQLRIEQRQQEQEDEENASKQKQSQWRLALALDLDGLGPLYFDLTLAQGQLDTRIWAERPLALKLLQATTEDLAERLRKLDLTVPAIACHLGKPVMLKTQLSQRLIDERA